MNRIYIILQGLKYLGIMDKKIIWVDELGSTFVKKFNSKDEVDQYLKDNLPLSKKWTIASYFA